MPEDISLNSELISDAALVDIANTPGTSVDKHNTSADHDNSNFKANKAKAKNSTL